MAKSLFLIKGNICAERVRLGRALQKPPMTQDDLARKIQFMGMDMTPLIISRIEKNQRHVCDADLQQPGQRHDLPQRRQGVASEEGGAIFPRKGSVTEGRNERKHLIQALD